MDKKKKGNPDTGNSYTEIHIDHVQNFNPNATTVINITYSGSEKYEKHQASGNSKGVEKDVIRPEIIKYIMKILDYVSAEWKNKYDTLWEDILDIKDVDAEVYNKGGQKGTEFNRVLVAGIIHVLKDSKVYIKCTYTALATALEKNQDHHVRQELGKYPSDEIQTAVNQLLKSKKFK